MINKIIKKLKSQNLSIGDPYLEDENIDYIDYAEYIAENLEKSVQYSEYIAENLDKNLEYSEYLAENLDGYESEENRRKREQRELKEIRNKKINRLF